MRLTSVLWAALLMGALFSMGALAEGDADAASDNDLATKDDFDDFFSELDVLETSTVLTTSTPEPEPSTKATSLDTATPVAIIADNGVVVAPYTPEIGYRMADKLSDQIRLFLKHFQQADPIGIPGAVLPDPMPLQDLTKSFSLFGSVSFRNIKLYELSQFRLSHINTDLENMQVYVEIEMKRLVSLGNYTMKTVMKNAKGPFNITMVNVVAEGAVALERDEKGQLQATNSQMDMTCSNIIIDMKDSGMAAVADGLGPFMFQSIKPVLLRKLNTDIRTDINKQIKKFTAKIPVNVSPLDLGIYEARRYVRNNHYDPYQLKNYSYKINLVRINISDLWMEGLSNFNRVGDLGLSLDKGMIQFGIHVITSKLNGYLKWSVNFSNKRSIVEAGTLQYSVDYLQVRISVNQSVNINHKPVINDIDIRLGKISIKHVGLKSFDYLIESVVNNYIPDILKFLIVDSIEEPLKWKIQEILNHTLVDKYSIDNILNDKVLPKLDDFVTSYNENKTYDNVTYDTTPAAMRVPTTTAPVVEQTTPSGSSFTVGSATLNVPSISLNDLVTHSKGALLNGTQAVVDSVAETRNKTEGFVSEKLGEAAAVGSI